MISSWKAALQKGSEGPGRPQGEHKLAVHPHGKQPPGLC